jgi:hypothetical protein
LAFRSRESENFIMAVLSLENRQRVWRGLMRYWSGLSETVALSKSDLQAAVDATDSWIDDNQTAFNQALPATAQTNLTQGQKVFLLCVVALMRLDPGAADALRRILGEVD